MNGYRKFHIVCYRNGARKSLPQRGKVAAARLTDEVSKYKATFIYKLLIRLVPRHLLPQEKANQEQPHRLCTPKNIAAPRKQTTRLSCKKSGGLYQLYLSSRK